MNGARRVAAPVSRTGVQVDGLQPNKRPIHTQHVERGAALRKEHECPDTACGRRKHLEKLRGDSKEPCAVH